jgi:hypothetical protein
VRLACSWTALLPVAVHVAGFALNRDIPCGVSITIALHGHALRRLSIARLGVHTEFLMQKGQLLQFVESGPPLGIGTTMAWCRL